MDFTSKLNQIIDLQQSVAHLNPLFERHYPIAVAVDEQFLIHEFDPQSGGYVLTLSEPVPFPIPDGVRAAFPMGALDGRSAAVVTPDAFDSLKERVLVLHEFVHCYQHLTCEQSLRDQLVIARQEEAKGHHTWELDTPFPYESEAFTEHYGAYLSALNADKQAEVFQARTELHSALSPLDWEYMVWQEWKEGYARHVENKIQRELDLKVNTYGEEPPYNRITFYVGGAAFIDLLERHHLAMVKDLSALFEMMLAGDL